MTAFFRIADSCATSQSTFNISSAVIYLSCMNFSNSSYMTSTSFSLPHSDSDSLPLSIYPLRSSGFILYCTSSERSDFTSLIYPMRFIFRPMTPSSSALSCAIFRSTRFFPVSSNTSSVPIPSSSNTRYARRLKLSTSIFMIALFSDRSTSFRCVCIVNCSGTITR